MNENEYASKIQNFRNSLYRTACLYLGNEAEALNAVDAAVYKGLVSIKGLRQPECFNPWLMRILINECKAELSRRKRSATIAEFPETAVEKFDALSLREAVLRLPLDLKEPVILHYFSGLTAAETASALNISQGTVATRLSRAAQLLRLEPLEEGVFNESK